MTNVSSTNLVHNFGGEKNLVRLENNDMNNKSALVKHVYSQNHHMDWNNSKILAKKQIIQEED